MRFATLSLLLVLAACGKDDTDDTQRPPRDTDPADTDPVDTDEEDTDPPASECASTPVDECGDVIECRLIKGYKIVPDDADGYCVAFQLSPGGTDLGCRHAEDTCSGTAAWARAKTKPGTCNYFEAGCVPRGWVDCDEPEQETAVACDGDPPA